MGQKVHVQASWSAGYTTQCVHVGLVGWSFGTLTSSSQFTNITKGEYTPVGQPIDSHHTSKLKHQLQLECCRILHCILVEAPSKNNFKKFLPQLFTGFIQNTQICPCGHMGGVQLDGTYISLKSIHGLILLLVQNSKEEQKN